ncbi:hypothetical protein [uncultured Lutibacter sp.]|uniref:hypothetical protein n=1 Tax=uncultured Lutibacter sp. TaxID=437739 RepID=UPI00261A4AD5|nr:hypothetical protein [uncultured Lutibacter sp.]
MDKLNIFDNKYINLFLPNDGVEFLFNIINDGLGYNVNKPSSLHEREETLFIIEKLFKLDLIYVFHWGENHEKMKNEKFTIAETLNYINSIWFEKAYYPDYYGMVMFGHNKWYTNKLESLGMTDRTDWKWFVKNKIGNLEKFIEDNRPPK